ncbi:hypothetical protein HXX76_006268 [Chlamydomonas incerta]|uniref:Uncharacterized protein n=1 Tax=Chlamydomonas incerta TaxID=51695 RepID=A0A835TAG3_CHLIN|nr:hypothetical protein HXX76_006268 [Chlamydomonas incerta]|eukprot:KAG2436744.1 hypothetical protein HXX76_006268 [Chlamydomonas incerta]
MDDAGRTGHLTQPADFDAGGRWTVSDPNILLPGADAVGAGWAETPGSAATCASECSSPGRTQSGAPGTDLRAAVREALTLVEGLRQQQERLLRRLDKSGVTGAPHVPAAGFTTTAHCGSCSADVAALAAKRQQQHNFAHACCLGGGHHPQQLSLSAVDSPACGQHHHQHRHQNQQPGQQQNSHLSHPQQPQHQQLRIRTTRCSPEVHHHYQQQHPHPQHQHPHSQPHPQLASTHGSGSAARPRLLQHRSLHRPHHHHLLHLRASASGRSLRVGLGSPVASPPASRTPHAAAGSPGITFAGGSHAIPEDAAACMGAVVEVSATCGSGGGSNDGGGGGGGGGGGLGSRRRSRLSLLPFGIELAEEEEARREQQLYTVCSAFATLAAAAAVDEPEEATGGAGGLRPFSSAAAAGAFDGFSSAGGGAMPRCTSVADVAPIIAAYSCATPLRLRAAAGVSSASGNGGGGGRTRAGTGSGSGADERDAALCGSDDGEGADEEEQYGWLYSSDDEGDTDRPTRASVAEVAAPPPASGGGGGGGGDGSASQQPSRFSWARLFTAPLRVFPGVSGLDDEDAGPRASAPGRALTPVASTARAAADGDGGRSACDTPPPSQPPPQRSATDTNVGAAGGACRGSGVVGGSSGSAAGSGIRSETGSSWATQLTRSNSRRNSRSVGVRSDGSDCPDQQQGTAGAAGSMAAPRPRAAAARPSAGGSAAGHDGVRNSCDSEVGPTGRPAPRLSLFLEGGSSAASRRVLQLGSTVAVGSASAGGAPTAPTIPVSRYSWRRLTRI